MKVHLIQAPSQSVYDRFKRKPIKRLPLGLACIAAKCTEDGHTTVVTDADADELTEKDVIEEILQSVPDIVGFTCTTPVYPVVAEITSKLKKLAPSVKTVFGGPHISALPHDVLRECRDVDFIVTGEGELPFSKLLSSLENGGTGKDVHGVGGNTSDGPFLNKTCSFIDNLDDLPFPARELFPIEKYFDPDRYNEPYTLLATSRGCPFNCIFCGSSVTWKRKTRFRSPANVLAELKHVHENNGIRNITFCDDTFALNNERTAEICSGIIENGLDISFLCSARVNTINEEAIEHLARAGCSEISFGIESADRSILERIRKGIDPDDVIPVFNMVKKHGIRVHSSYIIGNPGDTHETIKKTIDFAVASGTDAAQFSIAMPYPGTPMWDEAVESGKLKHRNYAEYKWYYSVVANLSEVTDEELTAYQKMAYERFNAESGNKDIF